MATDAAMEDTMYYYERALMSDTIDLAQFLKIYRNMGKIHFVFFLKKKIFQ